MLLSLLPVSLSQVLNEYFHNVCELDLVFNFYKVSVVGRGQSGRGRVGVAVTGRGPEHQQSFWASCSLFPSPQCSSLHPASPGLPPSLPQVYTVVDEMFLAGEIRETSQTKVLKQLLMLQSLE